MHDAEIAASVVVCTRDRSALLAEACATILEVEAPSGGWELVIIDNASTDDTRQVADSVRNLAPDLVRVVAEPTVGLSAARNRGIAEARGAVVAFIDDDAFPDRGWLKPSSQRLAKTGWLAPAVRWNPCSRASCRPGSAVATCPT